MKTRNIFVSGVVIVLIYLLFSCNDHPQPKPRGYFRIDMPEKSYVSLDSIDAYSFLVPSYSEITNDPFSPQEKNWININFPAFKSTLHISYKDVDNNLDKLLNDAYSMVTKHIGKASGIRDSLIIDPERQMYGLVYNLDGDGVASPMQFYLTDSTSHFLRGSLYFNIKINTDSLQPVTDFIKKDVEMLISSIKWK